LNVEKSSNIHIDNCIILVTIPEPLRGIKTKTSDDSGGGISFLLQGLPIPDYRKVSIFLYFIWTILCFSYFIL